MKTLHSHSALYDDDKNELLVAFLVNLNILLAFIILFLASFIVALGLTGSHSESNAGHVFAKMPAPVTSINE